jgi:hypothetical protein
MPNSPSSTESSPAENGSGDEATRNKQLQTSFFRLLAGFEGRNAEVDRRIKRVGALFRRDPNDESLPGLLDRLVDSVLASGMTAAPPVPATQKIAELLNQSPPAGEFAEQTRFLRNRLRDASSAPEVERALSELVGLINLLAQRSARREESSAEMSELLLLNTALDELHLPETLLPTVAGYRERLARPLTRQAQLETSRQLGRALAGYFEQIADKNAPVETENLGDTDRNRAVWREAGTGLLCQPAAGQRRTQLADWRMSRSCYLADSRRRSCLEPGGIPNMAECRTASCL